MRPLVLGIKELTQLTALKQYAEANPVSLETLYLQMDGKADPIGNKAEHTLVLPFDFRVVYSIEKQPIGDVRHLSVSVPAFKKLPNPAAVQLIMKALGFQRDLPECKVWVENDIAINVVEPILIIKSNPTA